jgi:hypothetical protein
MDDGEQEPRRTEPPVGTKPPRARNTKLTRAETPAGLGLGYHLPWAKLVVFLGNYGQRTPTTRAACGLGSGVFGLPRAKYSAVWATVGIISSGLGYHGQKLPWYSGSMANGQTFLRLRRAVNSATHGHRTPNAWARRGHGSSPNKARWVWPICPYRALQAPASTRKTRPAIFRSARWRGVVEFGPAKGSQPGSSCRLSGNFDNRTEPG